MRYEFPIDITGNRVVYCAELTNGDLIALQKFFETEDKTAICTAFESLIENKINSQDCTLNCVDKLIILLELRRNCISKVIDIIINNKTTSVSLKDIIENINSNYVDKQLIINEDNLKIYCNTPIFFSFYNSFYDYINKVQLDNFEKILDDEDRFEILEELPVSLTRKLNKIKHKFKQNTIKLFDIITDTEVQPYYFSYTNKEMYELVISCYKSNLQSLYKTQYICLSKLNMQPSEYNRLTPGETKILIKCLIDENEKQNKSAGLNQSFK